MILTIGAITLKMVYVGVVSRQPRFSEDGTTYLWTDWRIEATCVYNPRSTAYELNAAGVPVSTVGTRAAETDVAIREYLGQPRRQVTITSEPDGAGVVHMLLQSPGPGFDVDYNHGPKVTVLDIVDPVGQFKTFQIRLVIETAVRESPHDHVLLSHRWRAYMDADLETNYLQTKTIEGECVFNLPVLAKNNYHPDDFRAALFHPVQDNFQRVHVKASPASDGMVYHYVAVDMERIFNTGADCPAIRIEVDKTAGYDQPNLYTGLANVGRAFLGAGQGTAGAALNYHQTASFGRNGRRIAGRQAGISGLSIAGNLMGEVAGAVVGTLPVFWRSVTVRVWGNRSAKKADLIGAGMGVLLYQCQLPFEGVGQTFSIIEDVGGRYIELQRTVTWGREVINEATVSPLDATIERAIAPLGGPVRNPLPMLRTMKTALQGFGVNHLSATLQDGKTDNPGLKRDSQGETIVRLMEQALAGPGELPPSPPRTVRFGDVNRPLT